MDLKPETPKVEQSGTNSLLEADCLESGLVDQLLKSADHFGKCPQGDLLRQAANRLWCLENAASYLLKGDETSDMALIRKGLNGFKILCF